MGYCLPCFGSSKHRKSTSKTHLLISSGCQRNGACEIQQPTEATGQEVENKIEPIVDSNNASRNKQEEQLDGNIVTKKVTFDLNVKTHEEFPTQKINNCSVELENKRENEKKKEATQNESQAQSDSSMSSLFTYPRSHRYHNCTSSDDDDDGGESEAMELLESDSDDNQESDSLFSISIDSRKQISAPEIDEKEVNSPIPIRSSPDNKLKSIGLVQNERRKDLQSVLNPIENLTRWKANKTTKPTPLKDQEKENINMEPHLKSSNGDSKPRFNSLKSDLDDIADDTSLSSWLVESETTSNSNNSLNNSVGNSPGMVKSSRSYDEGRRILGALTVEEHR